MHIHKQMGDVIYIPAKSHCSTGGGNAQTKKKCIKYICLQENKHINMQENSTGHL